MNTDSQVLVSLNPIDPVLRIVICESAALKRSFKLHHKNHYLLLQEVYPRER